METQIKFSILIPAFKDKYLFECISSILSQTYDNYEIIIVDDASPYDLQSIVKRFSDSRISFYRNKNGFGGRDVVKNWNECLKYASGQYTMCIGDDDKLLPNCLLDYIKIIEKHPGLNLYHMRTEIINELSEVIDIQEARPSQESALSLLFHRIRGRKQFIGDFLFNTCFLKENDGFFELPSGCCSDDITAIKAASFHGVANTHIPGFQYRDNYQTLSRRSDNMKLKLEAFFIAKKWYKQYLLTQNPISDLDIVYKKMILKEIDGYIYRNSLYCVKKDVHVGGIKSVLFWLSKRKSFQLNPFFIIRCLFQ